ncbi:hypothetical protein XENOCAPTIV_011373 [Xenoophorus captivus]|uniref:Uncharacterized protein n=1 Tax=Xenoophorus captivus TaxID=1517983 RepID=A0ABV0QLM0_9TELE
MERLSVHLQRHASNVVSLELGFTELTDEAFLQLLPTLASLPHLETLALNGNRLTRAILKELTDALKPFLVSLRKRCPKQGNLPTILEFGESQASDPPERLRGLGEEEETDDTNLTESMGELRSESRSSRLSCSSQSQHSCAAVEPMRVEEEDMTAQSEHLT